MESCEPKVTLSGRVGVAAIQSYRHLLWASHEQGLTLGNQQVFLKSCFAWNRSPDAQRQEKGRASVLPADEAPAVSCVFLLTPQFIHSTDISLASILCCLPTVLMAEYTQASKVGSERKESCCT